MNEMDKVWRSIYSLSERCEELEEKVSLLERELDDEMGMGPTDDEDKGVIGNILDRVDGQDREEFLGEVAYDPN